MAERWACLARYVCDLPTREERQACLRRWRARHGVDSAARLRDAVERVWDARRKTPRRQPRRTYV